MNYAVLNENNVVVNLIYVFVGTPMPNAIPCNELPVIIGDTYNNGSFHRNGKLVELDSVVAYRTIDQLQQDNDALMDMLYEADGGTPVNESDN